MGTPNVAAPHLLLALKYARKGHYVHPLCWTTEDGQWACGHNHTEKSAGKALLAAHGYNDATCDEATIRDWWQR